MMIYEESSYQGINSVTRDDPWISQDFIYFLFNYYYILLQYNTKGPVLELFLHTRTYNDTYYQEEEGGIIIIN